MKILDWNYERKRTRDRLIEYTINIIAPMPHSINLPYIYPWDTKQIDNNVEEND